MRSGLFNMALGLAAFAASGIGCVDEMAPDPADVSTTSAPIQGGQLETGYPAVGMVSLASGNFCTGTLIAPSYVLTAAHCAGTGMVFKTGTSAADFIDHPVDHQIKHPTLDQMIVHLASPILNITPVAFDDGP